MSGTRQVLNLTRGNVLCERVELADRILPRMRGAMGRASLPPGKGILLQPAPSIHTAFVRFAFDAVFLDGNMRVVRIVERLKPWRVVSARRGLSVLELAAGEVEHREVRVGDQIVVTDGQPGFGVPDAPDAEPAHETQAEVEAEAPRVLLVGTDRRFRSVTAALLERRGYEVTIGEQVASMADVAARERVDVVVLDAGATPAVAALEAARLESLNPPVGMILVSDGSIRELPTTQIVPKWGSFDGLHDAIELVRAGRAPSRTD
jgi:uncharacterized membrane protein (UPF0127 family)/CheY-like chemotaxis protein